MWYFFPSEGGELIPWCPEVVLYITQPDVERFSFLKYIKLRVFCHKMKWALCGATLIGRYMDDASFCLSASDGPPDFRGRSARFSGTICPN